MANDSGCWKKWHSYCVMYWMARKQYHWKWPVVDKDVGWLLELNALHYLLWYWKWHVVDKDVGWLLELQCTSLFVMILEVICCWRRCGMVTGAPMHFTFCYVFPFLNFMMRFLIRIIETLIQKNTPSKGDLMNMTFESRIHWSIITW